MRKSNILLYFLLLAISVQSMIIDQTTKEYRWKNMQIRGGGFVTGVIYNTAEEGLLYARTNIGGAYCWIRINTDNQKFGSTNVVTGDPRMHGRMYIATGGRGILYGEPLYDCNGDMNGLQFESDICNGNCFIGKNLQSGVYILIISHNNETKRIKKIKNQK